MNLRPLSLIVGLLLLAACAQTPKDSGNTGGGGSGGGGGSTTTNAPAPGSQEEFATIVGDRVFFDYDKSVVKPEGRTTLQRQADWLKKYANFTVTIEGHCDERGTREYNLALGERRATAVRNALVALGIPANRLKTISYGKERPAVLGSNDAAWAQNRRGVTVLT
jgi:peptidoglycan-associated lipoprotein